MFPHTEAPVPLTSDWTGGKAGPVFVQGSPVERLRKCDLPRTN
jgi:hypothetical protein